MILKYYREAYVFIMENLRFQRESLFRTFSVCLVHSVI